MRKIINCLCRPSLIFFVSVLSANIFLSSVAFSAPVRNRLAVIDPSPKPVFESEKKKMIESYLASCSDCELHNITPYNAKGHFEAGELASELGKLPKEGRTVVLSLWNRKAEDSDEGLLQQIKKLQEQGVIFVATAGRPAANQAIVGLNRTLWGQDDNVLIIGELNERERLPPGSFFGPEMLTAIRTPASFVGQDMAAMLFSARLLSECKRKPASEWVSFLKSKKATSRRMWPQIEEFFSR